MNLTLGSDAVCLQPSFFLYFSLLSHNIMYTRHHLIGLLWNHVVQILRHISLSKSLYLIDNTFKNTINSTSFFVRVFTTTTTVSKGSFLANVQEGLSLWRLSKCANWLMTMLEQHQKRLLKKVILRIVQISIILIIFSGWCISSVSGGKFLK